MPELPEVETICRGIRPHIVGRRIERISHSGKSLRTPIPVEEMRQLLMGKTIREARRRAKYIVAEMEDGSLLIIHLGMTGNLGIFSPEREMAKHCHLRLLLNDGMEVRYTDVRRFGSIQVVSPEESGEIESTIFKTAGPEPFSDDFNVEYLFQAAQSRTIPVKTFIMTNQIVVGVGNIYANESLFMAGIDPRRSAATIDMKSWQKLIECIRKVLTHAIECGGSTISDYVNADQERGYFQINLLVYGRDGEDCKKCGRNLEKKQLNGRATYLCKYCQR